MNLRNLFSTVIVVVMGALFALSTITQAADGDAVFENRWTFDSAGPDNWGETGVADQMSTRNVPFKGGDNIVHLHAGQKAYFEMNYSTTGGENTWRTNQSNIPVACTLSPLGDVTGTSPVTKTSISTCVSAPIYIASDSATLCIDSDLGARANQIALLGLIRLCVDNDCTLTDSVRPGSLPTSDITQLPNESCGLTSASHSVLASGNFLLGGQTIYVQFARSSSDPGDEGETATIWITGWNKPDSESAN